MIEFLKASWELTKPRLTRMVVMTAICGAAVAPGSLSGTSWLALCFGSWAIVAAANAMNCFYERDVDALMERTKDRPLVTGRLGPSFAFWASLVLASLAILALYFGTNLLTAFLGFLGFLLYVGIYTPLKRFSMSAIFVGAIPGAIPPVMGWTGVTGKIEMGAGILFAILFFWQLPHFIAISLNRLNDYESAGLKTVPGTLGSNQALKHMLAYTALLILCSLLPYPMGLAGLLYVWATGLLGILFVGLCIAGFLKVVHLNWNRLIFIGSLIYLPIILGVWVLDNWLNLPS